MLFAQLDCFGPFALAWAGDVWTFLCQAQEGVERKEGGGGSLEAETFFFGVPSADFDVRKKTILRGEGALL